MSGTTKPTVKNEARQWRRRYLPSVFVGLIPLLGAYLAFLRSSGATPTERLLVGFSWLLVTAVAFLAVYAVYRIRVNLAYNRRPFTLKDRRYCYLAASVSLNAAVIIAIASLFGLPTHSQHNIGASDVLSAQVLCCLLLSSVLFLLGDVHTRGAKMFEELERGV
jgi:multisubunit Na+/H+ antiporter MnhB subunit